MNRAPLALRLAALSNSVLLAGALVWHRSRPGPVLMADGNSGVAASSAAKKPHQTQHGRTLLPGSKSGTNDLEETGFVLNWLLKYTDKPQPFEKAAKSITIMPGTKVWIMTEGVDMRALFNQADSESAASFKARPEQEPAKKEMKETPKVSHDYFPSNWEAWLTKE